MNHGNDASSAAAEGRVGQTLGSMAMAATANGGGTFKRFLVEEVIFDPHELDDDRIKDLQAKFGIAQAAFIKQMPPNTVIARLVNDSGSGHERHHYLFPFFPPHLALPSQAGEHVWAFFEEGKAIDHGFWLCRITEPRHVDDNNHTHSDRKHHVTELPKDAAAKFEGASDKKPSFDNGPTTIRDSKVVSAGSTASSSDVDPKAYEKLLKETDSAKTTDYEAVPRYRKRPGDTVLQGSNNTLIALGTDRTGRTAEFEGSDKGKRVKDKPKKDQKGKAGTIDVVTGRGQKKKTEIKEVDNSMGRKEGSKRKHDENREEGDPDFEFDLSRVYISMNTDADGNFGINFSSKESPGPATVVKTDHIRIIARKTAKILVQPEQDAPESKCAGILLKDGHVVFIPSSEGYVLLGGEDANMIPLCQPAGVKGGGQGSGAPIVSTIGSQVGIGGPNGQFPKKVFMK